MSRSNTECLQSCIIYAESEAASHLKVSSYKRDAETASHYFSAFKRECGPARYRYREHGLTGTHCRTAPFAAASLQFGRAADSGSKSKKRRKANDEGTKASKGQMQQEAFNGCNKIQMAIDKINAILLLHFRQTNLERQPFSFDSIPQITTSEGQIYSQRRAIT